MRDSGWPSRYDERDSDPEILAWRATLEQRHGRELFGSTASSIDIAPAITRWVIKHAHPVVANLSGLASELTGRITSYNVCYTKLLRDKLEWKPSDVVVVNLSGRGDKDLETYIKWGGY